jgi:Na+/H+-dicarboxylate symporter
VVNIFKKIGLPLQLIIIIAGAIFFGHVIPECIVRFFFTISMLFKEFLTTGLPLVVFTFVLSGILSFEKDAKSTLFFLFLIVAVSNFCAVMLSYGTSVVFMDTLTSAVLPVSLQAQTAITPFFTFSLPVIVTAEKALLLALFIGLFHAWRPIKMLSKYAENARELVILFINRYFIPFLPFYVLGFLFKLSYENVFVQMWSSYGYALVCIIVSQYVYVFLFYAVIARMRIKNIVMYVKEILPAYLAAFSTMSSTAAIPVTSRSIETMTKNSSFAHMVTPILANIHMLGDAIAVPMISLVTMKIFLGIIPGIWQYFHFVLYFCTMLFAASGIPGGGIIIMMPFLKSVFGFTPEMSSLAIALHLLQDSFGTASNVAGDGAIAVVIERLRKRVFS